MMRDLTKGFRQPKRGLWQLEWVPFHSPLPEAPRFNVPWKWIGLGLAFAILGHLLPWEWAALHFLPLFGMAQQAIPYGQVDNDPNPANRIANREAWRRQSEMNTELYALQSRTISAADPRFASQPTTEAKISAAIAQAVLELASRVFIPAFMLPYDASLVTFNTGVQMVREGGSVDVYDVKAYGAKMPGISDHIAIAAATAGAVSVSGQVYFPPAFYFCTAGNNFDTIHDVQFVGAGGNASSIVMNAAGAHCLNFTGVCSRIVIRDLWLGSGAAQTSGFGLRIVGTSGVHSDSFHLENVTIQNVPTPFYQQWCDNSTFSHVRIVQSISGATTATWPLVSVVASLSNIYDDVFAIATVGRFPADGLVLDYDTDSIVVIDSQVMHTDGWGFRAMNSAGATGPRLSRLTNCYSEDNALGGFEISACRDIRLAGCHSAINGGPGYSFTGGDSWSVIDSLAYQNQTYGIIATGGTGGAITGNTCSNNSQLTNNTYDGIRVGSGMTGVRVTGNRSGDFIVTLTNKQRYGLSLASGGSDYLYVWANDLRNNNTGTIENFSSGANNLILDGNIERHAIARQVLLTDAATITFDASLGDIFFVTLGGNRTMGSPTGFVNGQRITVVVIQDGTGGRTLGWHSTFKQAWSDTGNTAGKRSTITFVAYGDGLFTQEAAQTPYI